MNDGSQRFPSTSPHTEVMAEESAALVRGAPPTPSFATLTRRVARATSEVARSPGVLPGVLATLVSCGNVLAAPFVSNQNQYLLPVQRDRVPALASDWLAGTQDPYPFFTSLMAPVADWAGPTGLRLVAFVGTLTAVVGVYLLARLISPRGSKGVPMLAMVMVGATLLVAPPGLFLDGTVMSAFSGLADQYVLSKPGYAQPSIGGSLLLLALPLWIENFRDVSGSRAWRLGLAWLLTGLGCMMHPTYMVVALVGLAAALAADLLTGAGARRLVRYGTIALSLVVVSVAANPAMLDLASVASGSSEALDRFAFHRIPAHTLWREWPTTDLWRLALMALAIYHLPRMRSGRWLSKWVLVAATIAVASALIVDLTRWSTLALLFPWRISVLLFPVSATVLAVWASNAARRFAGEHWRIRLVAASAVIAALGLTGTFLDVSPAVSDDVTALVRSTRPSGVGMIPLAEQNVRLNAEVPVYVDWKSPPYAGEDLVEWWRRVDRVRAVADNPEVFCRADWTEEIDWIVYDAARPLPPCVSRWAALGRSGRWTVYQRSD